MDKFCKLLGIIALAAITGFSMTGCTSLPPPDSTPTIFEGIWVHPNPEAQNAKYIFSGNSFSYQWDTGNRNGRFKFDDKRITFIPDGGGSWSTSYTKSHEVLRLDQGSGGWHWGSFQGVDSNQNIKLDGSWKHTMAQAQGAAYTFNGNQFTYKLNNGFSAAGDFDFTESKLTIKVGGKVVREYNCYFLGNASRIYLISRSGNAQDFSYGIFEKQ